MADESPDLSPPHFHPIAIGALYPGIERGLTADLLATRALGGSAHPVCSVLAVAGHGTVTDVLAVPTDTVEAQLQHLFRTTAPNAAKIGIVSHPATIEAVFRQLNTHLDGPLVLDLTLSGPSGEDLINQRGLDELIDHIAQPDLVTLRRVDAELVAGMEIPSLDDAQVAAQRLAKRGARRVLLRCGRIPSHFFDLESEPPNYAVDLYYDGNDFALYEAPHLDGIDDVRGASSALLMRLLHELWRGSSISDALQRAKAFVTEALRHGEKYDKVAAPHYFWKEARELLSL